MRKSTFLSAAFLMLACATTTFAQSRKTWDFTKGWSDQTKANLNADAANWGANRTNSETGEVTGWKDLGTKLSGTLMANGEVISELEGLTFGTAGLSTNNNYLLDPTCIRMQRAGMILNLPKLAAGQTVTINSASANTTSERGIQANTSNLTRIAGPENDVAPGSAGTQINVWTVNPDVTDSVEISFKILVGGVNIYLVQIDNGDGGDVPETPVVAYLYDGNDASAEPINEFLSSSTTLFENAITSMINLSDYTGEKSLQDSLEACNVVIYSEAIPATHDSVSFLYDMLNRVPVMSFNAALYKAWGMGDVVTPAYTASFSVPDSAAQAHEIFANTTIEENNLLMSEEEAGESTFLYGYSLSENSDFADDEVLAYAGDAKAIHLHGTKNTYMLMPMSLASVVAGGDPMLSGEANTLLSDARTYLTSTKGKVMNANKPSIISTYLNGCTVVKLSTGILGGKIYYTTDGTVPTKQSTQFREDSDSLLVYDNGFVVNAFVAAPAYNNSPMATDTIIVKTQTNAPVCNVTYDGDTARVSFSADADATVYYNFTGSLDPNRSSVYDSEAGLNITRISIMTYFALADNKLASEGNTKVIDFDSQTYYNDTLTHVTFGSDFGSGDLVKAYNYYNTTPADSTEVVDTLGNVSYIYTYLPTDSLTEVYCTDAWKVGTYGQRINKQTTGTSAEIMGSYGPATAFDAGATSNAMSFLVTAKSGDPASAYLASRTTYKAPFNVMLWFCSQATSAASLDGGYDEALAVLVSSDSVNWTVIDTVTTSYNKIVEMQSVVYTGTDNVYVKVASANPAKTGNKQKTMLFDVMIMGPAEHPTVGIAEMPISGAKTVVATRMYNLAGQQIGQAENGINILLKVYSDGSVETKKIMVK